MLQFGLSWFVESDYLCEVLSVAVTTERLDVHVSNVNGLFFVVTGSSSFLGGSALHVELHLLLELPSSFAVAEMLSRLT